MWELEKKYMWELGLRIVLTERGCEVCPDLADSKVEITGDLSFGGSISDESDVKHLFCNNDFLLVDTFLDVDNEWHFVVVRHSFQGLVYAFVLTTSVFRHHHIRFHTS